MAKIVGLPKLSPTMEEGTLARWAKSEGDKVEIDELIAEVETDKATMEWRAFDAGVLLKRLVEEGATLEPDAPVAIFGQAGEDIAALLKEVGNGGAAKSANGEGAADKKAPAKTEAKKAESSRTESPKTDEAKQESKKAAPTKAAAPAQAESNEQASGRVLASPLVRRIARERDLDLATVEGTGPKGRVIKRDVEGAQARVAEPASRGERRPPRVEKLSQMRKTIARRLVESKQNVPHFYLTIDVDAGPIMNARAAVNAELEHDGEKVSVNDLVIKAAAIALRRVPEANASFTPEGLAFHQVVDVSMAVAIPDGLVTPVIRDADLKGIREIAAEARGLAQRARDKKLTPEEMTGGTFSVSNLGMFGIEEFAAVINPPEGCILAVGAVRDEPVVQGGVVVAGKRMKVTLSCDHRVVDGATGAKWLAAFKKIAENPVLMLL